MASPEESSLEVVPVERQERSFRLASHELIASSGLAFKAFHKPNDEGFHFDLIEAKCLHFFWFHPHRRKVSTAHVASVLVIILGKLGNQVIQMLATKENELCQALIFDRPDELLTATIQVRAAFGKFIGAKAMRLQGLSKLSNKV